MVVLITLPDAKISDASRSFANMLEASFNFRKTKHDTLLNNINPAFVNVSTSDAANTDFTKEFYYRANNTTIHIDIRSYDPTDLGSSMASKDFIVCKAAEVTNDSLNEMIVNALNDFSEVSEETIDVSTMYTSTYASLILELPTISLLINEGSSELYRSGADALAETVVEYVHHSKD